MLWRRKNKRFTARLNTVVETAEQTRQAFKPREPRVTIDTSFVDQQAVSASAEIAARKAALQQTYAPQREARLAPPQAAADAPHAPDNDQMASGPQAPIEDGDGDPMTVEEMVAELTELRDLTTLFDRELSKAQADNEALRAQAAARDQQIEDLIRDLSAAEVATAPPAPAPAPDTAQLDALQQQVDALRGELAREREARADAVAQAEDARRATQAAKAAQLAAPAPAAAGSAKEVAALKEAMALLRANHEAELLAEQAARRAVEAQKELADRRLAAAQRHTQVIEETAAEISRLQAERDDIAARASGLQTEIARLNEARSALEAKLAQSADMARARDELAARCAALEAELKMSQERLEAQAHEMASTAAASRQAHAALQQVQAAQTDLAARLAARDAEIEALTGAGRAELEAAIAARDSELEAERAARLAAEASAADLADTLAATEQHIARLKVVEAGLVAAKIEADAQRELAAQLDEDLKTQSAQQANAEANVASMKARIADLERQLQQAGATASAAARDDAAVAGLNQTIANLEARLAQELGMRAEAERRLADADARLADMQTKLQLAATTAATATTDEAAFAGMRQSIAALEARLAQEQADRIELETRLAASEARGAELSLESARTSSSNRELLASTRREADTLRALVAQLESDLKAEQEAAEAARIELENAHKMLDELPEADDADEAASGSAGQAPLAVRGQTSSFDRDAAFATGPIPLVAQQSRVDLASFSSSQDADQAASETVEPAGSAERSGAQTGLGPEGRRERRTQSQAPATVWQAGMSHAMACTIRNRSSGGALLEFPRDRHGMGVTEFSVGDELTLTFTSYRERSSVRCIVTRIEGRMCGVKFAGQFHVELLKPVKPKKPMPGKEPQAPAAAPAKGGLNKLLGGKLGRT